jgi:hypothetical protein
MSITTLSMGVFRERPKLLFGALGVVIPQRSFFGNVNEFRFHESWPLSPAGEESTQGLELQRVT